MKLKQLGMGQVLEYLSDTTKLEPHLVCVVKVGKVKVLVQKTTGRKVWIMPKSLRVPKR